MHVILGSHLEEMRRRKALGYSLGQKPSFVRDLTVHMGSPVLLCDADGVLAAHCDFDCFAMREQALVGRLQDSWADTYSVFSLLPQLSEPLSVLS